MTTPGIGEELEKLEKWISRWRPVRYALVRARRATLPGFEGMPIYDVMSFFIKELLDDRVTMRAAAVAFYLFLALFPGIIFLFTLTPFLPIEGFRAELFLTMESVLPSSGFKYLYATIDDITSKPRGGLLSIGFILAFLSTANGINAIMLSFDKKYEIYKQRSYLNRVIQAIKLTASLFMLLIISIFLIVIGDQIIAWIAVRLGMTSGLGLMLISLLRWAILIVLFFLGIGLVYHFGPAVKKKWRLISPGTSFAALFSLLSSGGFSLFINNFNFYNKVYGSIGAVMVVMIWIYLNALILLIGFELNSSIRYTSSLKAKLIDEE